MSYVALDIGSSSIKVAVLDPLKGTVTEIVKEPQVAPVGRFDLPGRRSRWKLHLKQPGEHTSCRCATQVA